MEDKLALLHRIVAEELIERISSGEASPSDLSNAIKFLKDNGIDSNLEDNAAPVIRLAESLPYPDVESEAI